jgi:hypothetical protein
LPSNLRISPCYDAWNRHVASLLAGEIAPEQAAADIAAEVTKALALPEPRSEEIL